MDQDPNQLPNAIPRWKIKAKGMWMILTAHDFVLLADETRMAHCVNGGPMMEHYIDRLKELGNEMEQLYKQQVRNALGLMQTMHDNLWKGKDDDNDNQST